jgi:hypothetical protein
MLRLIRTIYSSSTQMKNALAVAILIATASWSLAETENEGREDKADTALPGVTLSIEQPTKFVYQMGDEIPVAYTFGVDDPTFSGTMALRAVGCKITLIRRSDEKVLSSGGNECAFGGDKVPKGFRSGGSSSQLAHRLEPDDFELVFHVVGITPDGKERLLARSRRTVRIASNNEDAIIEKLNADVAQLRKRQEGDSIVYPALRRLVLTDDVVRAISWPRLLDTLDLSDSPRLHAASISHLANVTDMKALVLDGIPLSGADLAPLKRMYSLKVVSVSGLRCDTEEDRRVVQELIDEGMEVAR